MFRTCCGRDVYHNSREPVGKKARRAGELQPWRASAALLIGTYPAFRNAVSQRRSSETWGPWAVAEAMESWQTCRHPSLSIDHGYTPTTPTLPSTECVPHRYANRSQMLLSLPMLAITHHTPRIYVTPHAPYLSCLSVKRKKSTFKQKRSKECRTVRSISTR